MSAVVDAIGLVSAGLGLVSFLQSNWPGNNPEGPTVNIKAGLPPLGNSEDSLGGSINHIYSFDERNGFGGQADGCQVGDGGVCTVKVDQSVGGRRAGYIGVSNNNDATCIAWITVQQFDGSQGGAWTGDVGSFCGQRWYNSVEPAGNLKPEQGGGEYIPRCTWLDADHTNDIANAALKFDTAAYGTKVLDTVSNNRACASTLFAGQNGPIAGQPGAKRSTEERPQWMKEQLIMSNYTSQPAADLCNSETSWGPDFIGSDGQYCDMSSKTLTPLCSTQDVDGCIEVDETEGNLVKRTRVAKRTTNIVHKSYAKVSHWGH